MGDAPLGQLVLQAAGGDLGARLHGGREPGDPRHMLLHVGRNGVGQAVQVEVVLAQ
ncbi:hypothetical protein D3C72_2385220 [compost metagenome]